MYILYNCLQITSQGYFFYLIFRKKKTYNLKSNNSLEKRIFLIFLILWNV